MTGIILLHHVNLNCALAWHTFAIYCASLFSQNTTIYLLGLAQSLLRHTQASVNGSWAGSSVIHMGDHNVPNALSFIDKYTQVPKILAPLVACLHQLEALCDDDDESVQDLINDAFGSMLHLKLDVLHDFFRSAFDGSGAENYYDAGSCIDGRLTSAWNWCNELPQKPYYFALKLVGFSGFDGEFDA